MTEVFDDFMNCSPEVLGLPVHLSEDERHSAARSIETTRAQFVVDAISVELCSRLEQNETKRHALMRELSTIDNENLEIRRSLNAETKKEIITWSPDFQSEGELEVYLLFERLKNKRNKELLEEAKTLEPFSVQFSVFMEKGNYYTSWVNAHPDDIGRLFANSAVFNGLGLSVSRFEHHRNKLIDDGIIKRIDAGDSERGVSYTVMDPERFYADFMSVKGVGPRTVAAFMAMVKLQELYKNNNR